MAHWMANWLMVANLRPKLELRINDFPTFWVFFFNLSSFLNKSLDFFKLIKIFKLHSGQIWISRRSLQKDIMMKFKIFFHWMSLKISLEPSIIENSIRINYLVEILPTLRKVEIFIDRQADNFQRNLKFWQNLQTSKNSFKNFTFLDKLWRLYPIFHIHKTSSTHLFYSNPSNQSSQQTTHLSKKFKIVGEKFINYKWILRS
jgi:hypothetical protein